MDLVHGLANVFEIHNLLYCFLGCLFGTLVGVLPGLGPGATLSILLPMTMYLNPTGSIIMLAGIVYGAAYGGSTTSILVNIPGEAGSVPTTFAVNSRPSRSEILTWSAPSTTWLLVRM